MMTVGIKVLVANLAVLGALSLAGIAGSRPSHAASRAPASLAMPANLRQPVLVNITTHAALRHVLLIIDGNQVTPSIVAHDSTHYSISYRGPLPDGPHSAY